MAPVEEILVFVEDNCVACDRVVNIVYAFQRKGTIKRIKVINRNSDPQACAGVVIFPATFIDGVLTFYGEFPEDDFWLFLNRSRPLNRETYPIHTN